MLSSYALRFLSACICLSSYNVLSFAPQLRSPSSTATVAIRNGDIINEVSRSHTALFAGFGGGGASSSKKKKASKSKLPKLKAKSQWDRYKDMKTSQSVTVGVRIQGEIEWMEVGRVRSDKDENTEVAVAVQRALIAQHSKRLFPVQIPANAVLEWGYNMKTDDAEWIAVDKSMGDNSPGGIEKSIGFEGISDRASGYYCFFHEGRVIEREEDGMGNRGSGFAAVKGK